MVNIGELEILAVENSIISKKEGILARELKKAVKIELKKVKARENLMQRMLESSNIRKKLVEKNREIIDRKIKNKAILHIPDAVLNNEKDYTIYNERIAQIQNKSAKIHKKIADLEREISEERIKFANRKIDLSNERKQLSKFQFSYIKKVKKSSSKDKIADTQNLYINKQKEVEHARMRVMKKLNDIKKKENKLAIYKGELSATLNELEKIKHNNIPLD
ncbi:MAG: hypothetical protein ACFFBC_05480 [Promethearchaeota archaeon]